jgi:hypothetical protein
VNNEKARELLIEGLRLVHGLDQTSPVTFREEKPKAIAKLEEALALLMAHDLRKDAACS